MCSPWEVPYYMNVFYDYIFGLSESAFLVEEGFYKPKTFSKATDPLRMVSMNAKEGLLSSGVWSSRLADYEMLDVKERTGMTFMEFLELPLHFADDMLMRFKLEKMKRAQEPPPLPNQKQSPKDELMDNFIAGSKYRK